MKKWTLVLAVAIGVVAVAAFQSPAFTAQQPPVWQLSLAKIPPPASNVGEPQLTASARGVLLSWVERQGSTTTLRFAERTSTGWTEPRTVASGDDWTINAIDVPSVLRLRNGTLAAQWLKAGGRGMHANDVRLSYSQDNGRTWAQSFTPYRAGTSNQRLFASLFQMPGAGLGLIWLEGGAAEKDSTATVTPKHSSGSDHVHDQASGRKAHEGHRGQGGLGGSDTMTLRFASFDSAWKPTSELPVDLRVCECCSTAAVVTTDGVLAAYRDRSDEEVRDIYVSRLAQGRWSEPAAVHADNWRIQMCPINGPALSAIGNSVAIAWYTVKADQGQAYVAFSRDGGRRFSQPIRVDDSASLGRVDVELLPDGSALATWLEFADGRGQFRARRVTADGARSSTVTIANAAGGRTGGSPRVARYEDEVVFAWTETEDGKMQLRTAVTRLPGTLMR